MTAPGRRRAGDDLLNLLILTHGDDIGLIALSPLATGLRVWGLGVRARRRCLLGVLVVVLLPVARPASGVGLDASSVAGWTQFGGGAAHRYDGSGLGVHAATLRPRWRYIPGRAGLDGHGLEAAVQDGTVYVAGGTNNPAPPRTPAAVRALDLRTGRLKWQTPMRAAGDSFVYARPAVSQGVVVVNGANDEGRRGTALSGYRAADGRLLWRLPIPAVTVEPPTVDGGTAYIATQGGPAGDAEATAYAVEVGTGRVRWRRALPLQLPGPFTLSAGRLVSTGLATAGAGCATGRCLDTLDAATGRLLWHRPVPVNFSYPGDLLGYRGAVIGTDPDHGTACAYDATTGGRRWCIPIGRWPANAAATAAFGPTVDNGVLYAGFGRLTEADAASGRLLRRIPLPSGVTGGVVTAGSLLALVNNPRSALTPARLLMLDGRDGTRLADLGLVDTTQTDGRISVVRDSLLVTSYGRLTAFRAPACNAHVPYGLAKPYGSRDQRRFAGVLRSPGRGARTGGRFLGG